MRTATLASALNTAASLRGCATGAGAQNAGANASGTGGGVVVRAETREPTLSVTSIGRVSAPADEVVVILSVVTETESVDDAVRDNNRRSRDVADAIRRLEIDAGAVSTAGFRVTPRYRTDKNTGRQIGIVGYTVTNTVEVKTPKIELAGKIVEAGIDAGANRVLSLNFGLRSPETFRKQAVRDAVRNARDEADAAADAASLRITGVQNLSIQPDYNRPMYRVASARMEMDGGAGVGETPTNPGLIEVTAQVTIEYRIEPR